MVPLVIEESSVVAAAAGAAKFWAERGGFHSEVLGIEKIGQVHFSWNGGFDFLNRFFPKIREQMLINTSSITSNMMKRGGGILDIQLADMTDEIPDYYQVRATPWGQILSIHAWKNLRILYVILHPLALNFQAIACR